MANAPLSTGNVNQSSRKRSVAKGVKRADTPRKKKVTRVTKKKNRVSY